jgi:DNA polymerase-3 subunit gamma/tau
VVFLSVKDVRCLEYVALYRKWRPGDFAALVGQEHIRTALSNALTYGRLAHAYLFAGPRGTGKTSAARILAKAVNCAAGPTPEPCNACPNCLKINNGSFLDLFEIDAASNRGIDEIRDLRSKIHFLPAEGRKRVYIVDEAHMLTAEAFNALLKTLEEPPEHVMFILATTEPQRLPATILSRCQRYDFRRLSVADTVGRLAEVARDSKLSITPGALELIAVQSDGGLRDALSLLDQCSVMAEGEIDEEILRSFWGIAGREELRALVRAVGAGDARGALATFDRLTAAGRDIRQTVADLGAYVRALFVYKTAPDFAGLYMTDSREALAALAESFPKDRLLEAGRRLQEAAREIRQNIQPRIAAELCLLELCRLKSLPTREEMAERLDRLEALLAAAPRAKSAAVQESPPGTETVKPDPEPKREKFARPLDEKAPKAALEKAEIVRAPVQEAPADSPEAARDGGRTADAPAGGADLAAVWTQTLDKIKQQKKHTVYAYASQGKLTVLAGSEAQVEFSDHLPWQRMQKEEYRRLVEDALSETAGRPLSLACVRRNGENKPPAATPNAPAARPAREEAAEDDWPPAVKAALEVFGGEVFRLSGPED